MMTSYYIMCVSYHMGFELTQGLIEIFTSSTPTNEPPHELSNNVAF